MFSRGAMNAQNVARHGRDADYKKHPLLAIIGSLFGGGVWAAIFTTVIGFFSIAAKLAPVILDTEISKLFPSKAVSPTSSVTSASNHGFHTESLQLKLGVNLFSLFSISYLWDSNEDRYQSNPEKE